jgi:hypothetical protein
MIKIFRKIRQNMIKENKASKYLLYAIGEIILVVIGILIALQLNNWNENAKQSRIEQHYLVALKEEFTYNRVKLERVMNTNQNNADYALKISNLMGPDNPEITEKEFSTLAMEMTNWHVMYHPNQAVLDEIISSGKLSIFKNDTLKFALSSSKGLLSKIKFQEDEHSASRMNVIDIMNAEGNAKKMITDAQGDTFDIKESKFKLGNLQLLQSQKLENELMEFILTARYLNQNYYTELKTELDAILKLITNELESK